MYAVKRHRLILALACIALLTVRPAAAQFYLGGEDPGGLRWSSVETSTYRIIYPSGLDSLAREYARSLEQYRRAVGRSAGVMPGEWQWGRKTAVVLHTHTATSNATVVWAPKRLEIYTNPQAYETDPLPWIDNLTLHEQRHLSQMQMGYRGPHRILSYIVGEMWPGACAGIYVSTWDSDVSPDSRALMVSQGTAAVLGPMLVEMGVDSLKERGVDVNGEVKYVWHFSNPSVADQNSWYVAGEEYIKKTYPTWVAVHDPYFSEQDPAKSVSIGEALLEANPDVDLIICNDSTALPGQCGAAQNKGLTAADVTITGFCPPSGMTTYLDNGICTRWGLWDCGIQGAMGCYLAAYISAGNTVHVGDKIDIPGIGEVEILANSDLVAGQETAEENNGVVLLPERVVFTAENVANYPF